MSQAASQATAFYKEVARTGRLWTIRDADGFPAPMTASGHRAQPFWSSRSRAERVIKNVSAYAGFNAVEVLWDEFCAKWVTDLWAEGIKVGINWSGKHAVGYDLEPSDLQRRVEAELEWQSQAPETDDLSDETDCLGCGSTIPAGDVKCAACGWSYR
ncbi:MAG: DUF2750 domain-containing protein [Gemmataceae bacterium]